MLQKLTWRSFISSFLLVLLPCLLAGLIFGYLPWWICGGLLGLLGWNYVQQLKLSYWLWQDKSMTPPTAKGHWEVIFYGLLQLQKRNKKRRKELAALIKRFRSGAESLPDALVMITSDGTIFWCNKLAENLLGFKWPADNGQNIINLLRYPEFSRYIEEKQFDFPITLSLFTERDVEFRIMPYTEDQFIVMARDVTQVKQAEIARRNFFNNASHELGTPLTVLKGYLDMLEDDALNHCLPPKALLTMRAQSERMDKLIKQLLALSRLEYQIQASHKQRISLSDMLTTLQLSAEALNKNMHQFEFHIEPDLFVLGNSDELRSAMNNLIENAIKHTPQEAKIVVKLEANYDKTSAKFSVQDSGQGIAKEHIPHLTERFYRVDEARQRQSGGSGIGLAIVKHVLSRHQSELQIVSQLGKGSRFSFSIALDS